MKRIKYYFTKKIQLDFLYNFFDVQNIIQNWPEEKRQKFLLYANDEV